MPHGKRGASGACGFEDVSAGEVDVVQRRLDVFPAHVALEREGFHAVLGAVEDVVGDGAAGAATKIRPGSTLVAVQQIWCW